MWSIPCSLVAMAALAHSLTYYPAFVLPVLVVLILRGKCRPERAFLVCAGVWAVTQLVLLRPLAAPALAYRVDYRILGAEAIKFQENWSWELRCWSWVALLLAVPVVGKLSSLQRRTCFLGLLGLATALTLWTFDPSMLAEYTRINPRGYAHDHFFYQETWRQMKLGNQYYTAAAHAFAADVRGQGATVRPPVLFYVWALTCPMPPNSLYVAFSLMTLIAIGAADATARRLGAGDAGLVAAALMVPQYLYAGYSAGYLFVEYWLLPLASVSLYCLLSGRTRLALGIGLFCAISREFMLAYLLGLSVAIVWRDRSQWTTLFVAWIAVAFYYLVHVYLSILVIRGNHAAPDLWKGFANGGWDNLRACVEVGSLTLAPGPRVSWLLVGIGLLGLRRLETLPRWIFGLGVVPYFAIFLLLGHEPVRINDVDFHPTETWGEYIMMWWPLLVALALNPSARASDG